MAARNMSGGHFFWGKMRCFLVILGCDVRNFNIY